MTRAGPALLALALLAEGVPAPAGERPAVAFCAEDGALPAGLAEAMEPGLSRVAIAPPVRCRDPHSGEDGPSFLARFADEDGAVVLILSENGPGGTARRARIGWLERAESALEATAAAGKGLALAMILDGLVVDFLRLELRELPELPPEPEAGPEPEPPPEREPEPAPPLASEPGDPPARLALEIGAGAGAIYLPPGTFAPRLALSVALAGERWSAVLFGGYSFDSNFEVEGRPFETGVAFAGLAARLALLAGERLGLLLEGGAGWYLNRYTRDDIEGAKERRWSDLGIVLALIGRLRLAGPLSAFLRLGVEAWPTARTAVILGGPEARLPVVGVPALLGLELSFGPGSSSD